MEDKDTSHRLAKNIGVQEPRIGAIVSHGNPRLVLLRALRVVKGPALPVDRSGGQWLGLWVH